MADTLTTITTRADAIEDSEKTSFDLRIVDTTDAMADPKDITLNVSLTLGALIKKYYEGEFKDEWIRAVYRPRAGKVFTVSCASVFQALIPSAFPAYIFIMNETTMVKYKLEYAGPSTGAPFTVSSPDMNWLHFFVPVTCNASRPMIKERVQAALQSTHLRLNDGPNDFKCIDTEKGKWHANFSMVPGERGLVPENLYRLHAIVMPDKSEIGTWISPELMDKMSQNCPKCYQWLRWNDCNCPKEKSKNSAIKAAKNSDNAERRKRKAASVASFSQDDLSF